MGNPARMDRRSALKTIGITAASVLDLLESLPDDELLKLSPAKTPTDGLSRFCPHVPFPKQHLVLSLDETIISNGVNEVFFGGAAGPGKSDYLLMAALKYVHVPRYSALILRKDFQRLSLPGSIMDRALEWLADNPNVKVNLSNKRFTFPSGAKLQFGYIARPSDRFRYQSAEFQYVGWDELTEFTLPDDDSNPYTYVMSRVRRRKCKKHKYGDPSPHCYNCKVAGEHQKIPLRVRCASNPGGPGHEYVKNRFISDEAIEALKQGRGGVFWMDLEKTRAFVPAKLIDNPVIDYDEYAATLNHLPVVSRERLLNGDWSIIADAIISAEWLHYYQVEGQSIVCLDSLGKSLPNCVIDERKLSRSVFIDTAGTEKDIKAEQRGRGPSWSVAEVWDYWREKDYMFLRDVYRERVGWDELKGQIPKFLRRNRIRLVFVEDAHWGRPLASELRHQGYQVTLVSPGGKSKLQRSVPLQNKLKDGEVFLPLGNQSWRQPLEAEWLSWQGLPDEPADQIDTASYAADRLPKSTQAWGGQVASARKPATRF